MLAWESVEAGAYVLPILENEAVCFFQDQRQTRIQLSGTWAPGSAIFGGSRDVKDAFLLKQHHTDGGSRVHQVLGVFSPQSPTPTPGIPDTEMRKAALGERCDLADSWVLYVQMYF